MFEHLVPSWGTCLEKLSWCGLARGRGNRSLGRVWTLRVYSLASLPAPSPTSFLLLKKWSLSFLFLLPCLSLAVMTPHHDGHLSLWNHKPKCVLSSLSCYCSWCVITAPDKWLIQMITYSSTHNIVSHKIELIFLNDGIRVNFSLWEAVSLRIAYNLF